jgi:hypothetical protein
MPSGPRPSAQELLRAALQRDPEERDAFLDQACAGDARLRAEVALLLAARTSPTLDAGPSGRIIGPYIIRHEIGRGGMGVVYLAEDTRLSRRVALKALVPSVATEGARRERLRQEARAAAGLSHQGIATVYALEEFGSELFLACEYVAGQTLRAVLKSERLETPQVVEIAVQLARALAAAHAHGVVHRDLKPENIVRTASGIIKILDFGIARVDDLSSARLTQAGTILGTPAYMAPEQAEGQDVDSRTDLFSFGVLVYEMACGSNPFEGGTITKTITRILEWDPVPLSQACRSSFPRLDRIVAKCLRKRPSERYQSTTELVSDLEHLQAEFAADENGGSRRGSTIEYSADVRRVFTPRQWWAFHQLAMSAVYAAMLYPAWRARTWLPPPWGIVLLFAVSSCAVVAATLRLHLWFTARFYPSELLFQRMRLSPWIRWCDMALAGCQFVAAFAIVSDHTEFAMLELIVAVAIVVASLVIEPATTTAAFPERPQPDSRQA